MGFNIETTISIVLAVVCVVLFFNGTKIREVIQAFKKS